MKTLTLTFALVAVVGSSCTCGAPPKPPDVGEGEGEGDEGEGEGEGDPAFNACVAVDEGPGFAISAKADLRWKRAPQLEADLINALGGGVLDKNLICSEVGLAGTCFTLIHQVPLGANDPVKGGLYRPISEPGVTTPLSIDRVIISACGVRADAESIDVIPRIIYNDIDFTAASLSADDPAVRASIVELYHRLLARDPTAEESDIVASLTEPVNGTPVAPRDFAKMACYSVATSAEFLFQ